MTFRSRTTTPSSARDDLGVRAGTDPEPSCVTEDERSFRVASTGTSVMDLQGIAQYSGPPISLEEMERAIAP